jgi:acyl CoA:acetate/3-ketoacid CoA transferase beta subunit
MEVMSAFIADGRIRLGRGIAGGTRVYTNLAVLDVTGDAFAVREMAPGLSFGALQDVTDAPLTKAQ